MPATRAPRVDWAAADDFSVDDGLEGPAQTGVVLGEDGSLGACDGGRGKTAEEGEDFGFGKRFWNGQFSKEVAELRFVDGSVGIPHRSRCRGTRFDDDAVELWRYVFVVVEEVVTNLCYI